MSTQIPISYDELPLWMRQARQEFDWSILIALVMSIAIAWTFILRSQIPAGNQLEHQVFQATDIVTAFEEGRFYPRWSPYTIRGYGAPIPNYYPIGTPYIIASIETLFTNNIIQAVRITFILTYAIAGLSIYLFVSRRTDAPTGLLTSLIYLYSPMIGSTIPYVMGDLALLMASALLPLSLWSTYQVMQRYQPLTFIFHSMIVGLLLWVHPQMALIGIVLSYLYSILDKSDRHWTTYIPRLTFAILLGIFLVAFYWMPALLEYELVDWYPTLSLEQFTLDPLQLIGQFQQLDAGLVIPQAQFKLGHIIIFFSMLAIVTIVFRKLSYTRFYIITGIAGGIMLSAGLFVIPEEVWLLSPITLCFSIIAGSVICLRSQFRENIRRLILVFTIAITLIFSISVWLIPVPNLTLSQTDAVAQFHYEQQAFGYATLQKGAPLPSQISPDQPINRFLLNSYEANAPQRYDEQQNNANTIVSLLNTGTHQQTYRIFNAQPRELTFFIAYFDGWQAYLSDRPIPTYAHPQSGLLTVDVPRADNEELSIVLIPTPIRSTAWFISLSIVVVFIFMVIRNREIPQPNDNIDTLISTLHRTDIRLTLFMFVCLGILIAILTSDIPPINLQSPPGYTLSQSLPLRSRTNVGLEASTFELNQRIYRHNDLLELTIYWQTLTTIQSNFKSRLLLRDTNNRLIWYTGNLSYPGRLVSKRWMRQHYMPDTYHIQLPENLIAGEYQLLIEMYPCDMNTCNFDMPVQFFDISGNAVGKQLEIPLTITIQ